MWEYRARLAGTPEAAVHDGDTIRLLIDLGFDVRAEKWLRLDLVGAPEIGQPGGIECKRALVEMVRNIAAEPYEWPFRIVTATTRKKEPVEKVTFQRYVATVFGNRGVGLNEEIRHFILSHPEWGHGTGG